MDKVVEQAQPHKSKEVKYYECSSVRSNYLKRSFPWLKKKHFNLLWFWRARINTGWDN